MRRSPAPRIRDGIGSLSPGGFAGAALTSSRVMATGGRLGFRARLSVRGGAQRGLLRRLPGYRWPPPRSAPTIAWLSVAAAWALWPCVRAQAMLPDGRLAEDFHIERQMLPDGRLAEDFHIERQPGALHVLNAPSPAATASLAIGEHLAGLAEEG